MHQEDLEEKSSLYDFAYVDIDKLKSYCSQLDELGLLNTITTSKSNLSDKVGKFGAGKNPIIDVSSETKTSASESLTHTFDSSEALPFKAIEMLNAQDLINYDIEQANHGQIVLISGNAKMYDFSMISSSWENLVKMHVRNQNMSVGKNPKNKELSTDNKMIVNMLESMPPLMSFKIKDDCENTAWSALEKQHLIGSSYSYSLKHGTTMRGRWHILGILDATPYDHLISANDDYPEDDMLSALTGMGDAVRTLMGRKNNEFGLTPIAIWRMLK